MKFKHIEEITLIAPDIEAITLAASITLTLKQLTHPCKIITHYTLTVCGYT